MKLLGTDVASIPTNEVAPHQFGLAVVVTSRGVQRSLSNLMRKHENVCSPLMEDIRVGLMLEFDKLTEGSSFFGTMISLIYIKFIRVSFSFSFRKDKRKVKVSQASEVDNVG